MKALPYIAIIGGSFVGISYHYHGNNVHELIHPVKIVEATLPEPVRVPVPASPISLPIAEISNESVSMSRRRKPWPDKPTNYRNNIKKKRKQTR